MVFTEEDAENDGLIKREVGQQLNSTLSRKGGKLYQKFMDWCEENDRRPSEVLGDMALRAMRNEDFAQTLSSTTVDMSGLERQSIRREDLELITDMIEQLGVDESGGDKTMEAVDRMIEQRIEAMGSGPLGGMSGNKSNGDSSGGSGREIQRLEKKIERIEQAVASNSQSRQETETTTEVSEPEQTTDDIFSDISSDEETEETDTEETDAEVTLVEEDTEVIEADEEADEQIEEQAEDGNPFSTEEADE